MRSTLLPIARIAFAALAAVSLSVPARADATDISSACILDATELAHGAAGDITATADRGLHMIFLLRDRGAPPELVANVARRVEQLMVLRAEETIVRIRERGAACAQLLERMGARGTIVGDMLLRLADISRSLRVYTRGQVMRIEVELQA